MKLSPKEAAEARARALAYEANMAVEGLRIHPDDRAFIDQIDADAVGYEEAIAMMEAHYRKLGIIPEQGEGKPAIAAE